MANTNKSGGENKLYVSLSENVLHGVWVSQYVYPNCKQRRPSQKLTVPQLAKKKKYPAFYETRSFAALLTKPATCSIFSQINLVHAFPTHACKIHFNVILPSTPRSSKWSPSFRFPQQDPERISLLPMCAIFPARLNMHIRENYFFVNVISSILTYLLTYSMEQSPS